MNKVIEDWDKFCEERRNQARLAKDKKYETTDLQLAELLEAARNVLKTFRYRPRYGEEINDYNRLEEAVNEIQLRR